MAIEADRIYGVVVPERIAVKLIYVVERQLLGIHEETLVGRVQWVLLPKTTNEILSVVGTLRSGSLYGAWHHVRGLLEVRAAIQYLFRSPASERDIRLERYLEIPRTVAWQRARVLELALEKGKITQDYFDAHHPIAAAAAHDVTPAVVERWRRLFGPKIESQPHTISWHPGKKIGELLRDLEDGPDASWHYQVLCHPTHASAAGHNLTSRSGARLVWGEPDMITNAVASTVGLAWQIAGDLDDLFGYELREFIAPDVDVFVRNAASMPGMR